MDIKRYVAQIVVEWLIIMLCLNLLCGVGEYHHINAW